jgi:hypothetical protein
MNRSLALSLAGAALLLMATRSPGNAGENPPGGFDDRPPASDPELDAARGGFDAGNGFTISFGLERLIYLGDVLQSSTVLVFHDVGGASRQFPLSSSGVAGSSPSLPATLPTDVFTLVQNSQDFQTIKSLLRIDATVTCQTAIRNIALASSLNRQILMSMH